MPSTHCPRDLKSRIASSLTFRFAIYLRSRWSAGAFRILIPSRPLSSSGSQSAVLNLSAEWLVTHPLSCEGSHSCAYGSYVAFCLDRRQLLLARSSFDISTLSITNGMRTTSSFSYGMVSGPGSPFGFLAFRPTNGHAMGSVNGFSSLIESHHAQCTSYLSHL